MVYTAYEYKLRAGGPLFTESGGIKLHTFMAEKYEIDLLPVITEDSILTSSDFIGQGGEYISATYNRFKSKTGDKFNGRQVHKPVYVEESDMGGV